MTLDGQLVVDESLLPITVGRSDLYGILALPRADNRIPPATRIMKLSYRTIVALHHLATVSPTVLLGRAGELFALDATINLRATAQVPDRFPRNVAFDDIRILLAALDESRPNETDVTFGSNRCRVTTPEGQYPLAIANPHKLRELMRLKAETSGGRPRAIYEFPFGHEKFRSLQMALKPIKKTADYEMRLVSDGTTASWAAQRKSSKPLGREGGRGSYRPSEPLGKCPISFAFVFPISVLFRLPSDDYNALLTTRSKVTELRLTASTRPITYTVCMSVSTVETFRSKTSREA